MNINQRAILVTSPVRETLSNGVKIGFFFVFIENSCFLILTEPPICFNIIAPKRDCLQHIQINGIK